MSNTIGTVFRITTWGESHGDSVGAIIDGMPSNICVDYGLIEKDMKRRAPGQSSLTTPRKEDDKVEILSGVFDGKTTGTPISLLIKNTNTKSGDYDSLKDLFRPGHSDYSYYAKYGIRDHRGGGRTSARTTASIVACGAFAKMAIFERIPDFEIIAYVKSVHTIEADINPDEVKYEDVESNIIRCPDIEKAKEMIELVEKVKEEKDSVGGVIECVIRNIPAGIGEPIFNKLCGALANGLFSINAVKGVEFGKGFASTKYKGSENNDIFYNDNGVIKTKTNNCGGIIGGISIGMPVVFRIAFKPTSTIGKKQKTVNIFGDEVEFEGVGRHDPCVLPRAVPIVEAISSIILLDQFLLNEIYKK